MRRVLLLLFGLLLIGLLAYFCFGGKAQNIKDDLISKTERFYAGENIVGVEVGIKGEDLKQTRILTLSGTVSTEEEREKAEYWAKKVEGIEGVENQIVVKLHVPKKVEVETVEAPIERIEVLKEDNNTMPIEAEVEELPVIEVIAVPLCQNQFQDLLKANKIHFSHNKAIIESESYSLLDQLIEIANGCPDEVIVIEGHTDADGSESYNQKLSEKRANSVRDYLVNKSVVATRLEAIGYGETHPIADNETPEGKEKNRRIEFNIKGVE